MSVLNWIIDLDQATDLVKHEDRIKKLEEQVEILKEWVDYLKSELEQVKKK